MSYYDKKNSHIPQRQAGNRLENYVMVSRSETVLVLEQVVIILMVNFHVTSSDKPSL
jgi:hypothetical protein